MFIHRSLFVKYISNLEVACSCLHGTFSLLFYVAVVNLISL